MSESRSTKFQEPILTPQYVQCLFKQYCESTGFKRKFAEISEEEISVFGHWVFKNYNLLFQYWTYLQSEFHYSIKDVLEIGKGKYDSLWKLKMLDSFLFNNGSEEKNCHLYIDNGIPLIIRENKLVVPREHILLTHNPYFESEISYWYSIHNGNQKDISIGMFGSLEDEDRMKKINLLKELSKKMTDDYSLTYETDQGNYFCSLNSRRLTKKI